MPSSWTCTPGEPDANETATRTAAPYGEKVTALRTSCSTAWASRVKSPRTGAGSPATSIVHRTSRCRSWAWQAATAVSATMTRSTGAWSTASGAPAGQQVLDHPDQPVAVAPDRLDQRAVRGQGLVLGQHLQVALDAGHRRTQLVRDRRHQVLLPADRAGQLVAELGQQQP